MASPHGSNHDEDARSHDSTERNSINIGSTEEERSKNSSLLIVIVSLLFAGIFGGALIGGVVSGDPTNSFFITIIVASCLAIAMALGVSIRYYLIKYETDEAEFLSKEDIARTFSNSDEGNYQDSGEDIDKLQGESRDNYYSAQMHVNSEIKEIQAKSVYGEMSALSPQTYDEESLTTTRGQGRQAGLFDFSKNQSGSKTREDPPEGNGSSAFQTAWNTRGHSQDPSAPKFSTDGKIITDEEGETHDQSSNNDNCANTGSRIVSNLKDDRSVTLGENIRSKNIKQNENTLKFKIGSPTSKNNRSHHERTSVSASTSTRNIPKIPSGSRVIESSSPPEAKLLSSKNDRDVTNINSISDISNATPDATGSSTPTASEAGSFASSFLKPLNVMFGKSKKSQSEAENISNPDGAHTASCNDKVPPRYSSKKGRPPVIPSTKKGVFSIPPPRHIPPTPNGSEARSELQSLAGSAYTNAAASSTFDPKARQKALQKMQKTQAPVGANPLGGKSMPVYYEDDDTCKEESSIELDGVLSSDTLAYDVFAPPGSLGIVVDTNEKGCYIHSLKKVSPMLGLMNRGDLIIALDDFDVRNMSAASLTKLMAKKSQQGERKFTLMNLK